jgi:hypothetical protein
VWGDRSTSGRGRGCGGQQLGWESGDGELVRDGDVLRVVVEWVLLLLLGVGPQLR